MNGSILVSDFIEDNFAASLEEAAPKVPRVVLRPSGPSGSLAKIEIAYFSGDLYPDRSRDLFLPLLKVDSLAWLHSYSAGVDHPIFSTFRERGVRLTTSSGAAAPVIARSVIMYLLMLARGMPVWSKAQQAKSWQPHDIAEIAGRRLVVVGLGPIGLETVRLAKVMGMDVVGVRRSVRGDEPCRTVTFKDLDDVLKDADAVVLALPSNDETKNLFGAQRFSLLAPGAWFVNIARGDLVDESALLAALNDGRLGGAALDVVANEPLAADDALWQAPNIIITPHASGQSPQTLERATSIFLENLSRFVRGEALLNEIAGS